MNLAADTGPAEMLANLSVGTVVLAALALTFLRMVLLNLKTPRPGAKLEVHPLARAIAEIIESLIIAGVLVFLIIRPFFVQAFYIPSESMEPTLQGHEAGSTYTVYPYNPDSSVQPTYTDTIHDHIFVNKLVYRYSDPHDGDVVVFKAPKEADMESLQNGQPQKENILIKRVQGTPGDTLEVKTDQTITYNGKPVHASVLYRNGKPLDELSPTWPYHIKEPMNADQRGATYAVREPLKLGPNQYFVMGDNRNNSNDGRFWGILTRDRIIGKASFIFFPLGRIRILH